MNETQEKEKDTKQKTEFKAIKFISLKKEAIEGKPNESYEIKTYHTVNIDIGMTEQDVIEICESDLKCFDDAECDYFEKGVSCDFSDDLFAIDLTKFIDYIELVINELIEDGNEPSNDLKKLYNAIKPYKGYTIYF